MFRASCAHLQEDTVVHMQHMVLSQEKSELLTVSKRVQKLSFGK